MEKQVIQFLTSRIFSLHFFFFARNFKARVGHDLEGEGHFKQALYEW